MTTTHVEELEDLEEVAQPMADVAQTPIEHLQHVVDAWEEGAAEHPAESACTAAVRDWESRHR